jgi:hypothetical protein
MRSLLLATGTLLLLAGIVAAQPPRQQVSTKPPSAEALAFFEAKIRPLLIAKCYACHSASSQPIQAGLRLDSRESIFKGGKSGSAVDTDNPEKSLLLHAINATNNAPLMPPNGKLTEQEKILFTEWLRKGVPFGTIRPTPIKPNAKPFWAFVPPKPPALPKVSRKEWAQNPIDRFILADLDKKGLSPTQPTDRRTLLRRATFDLTGLPPTPKELDDFLNDTKPGAFARVVDRLLASSAYGERWGRHWLDVARYADSNGLDENLVFTQAWRYRDYVVRAINQDKPINHFIQEQIAGDLLPQSSDNALNMDRIIATGYLAIGPKMLAEDDPVKQEMDIIDEQIDTLGKTFMGITLGCSRCHDHKFDPFPATDYYALAGIFKSTKTMLNFQVVADWQERPLASQADQDRLKVVEDQIKERRQNSEKLRKACGEIALSKARRKIRYYFQAAKQIVEAERSRPTLLPKIEQNATNIPKESLLIEAEDFVRGNVLKDKTGFGKGIGVLVNAGEYPNYTEYEITPPQAGVYQIDLRYASGDPRPILLYVNGVLVNSNAAGQVSGGFNPDSQRWFSEGIFHLKAGKNTIRLQRESYFPHIDKILLSPTQGDKAQTPLTQETELLPELLAQVAEKIRYSKNITEQEITLELPESPDSLFAPSDQARLKAWAEEIKALEKQKPNLPRAMAVSEGKPTNLKVHLRGDYLTLGKECSRRFPVVLAGEKQTPIDNSRSGRLEFAHWLTRPDHPLTARVFVNRVWRWHFGKGIVGSTDNFGSLGERPSNQPLLDWLATTFVADGWSLKNLHRRIMLSKTYQQSTSTSAKAARIDPENRLLSHFPRRRLEAEAVRDAILAVSGQLDRTIGGSLLNFRHREYVTSTANADPVNYRSQRRSLYLPVIRSALYDVFTAFDFGDPTVMNGDRASTTVAPQALFMMNSPLVLEQSKLMAERLRGFTEWNDSLKINQAFLLCYGRPAKPAETERLLALLARLDQAYLPTTPKQEERLIRVWQSLCKTLLSSNEFIYIE